MERSHECVPFARILGNSLSLVHNKDKKDTRIRKDSFFGVTTVNLAGDLPRPRFRADTVNTCAAKISAAWTNISATAALHLNGDHRRCFSRRVRSGQSPNNIRDLLIRPPSQHPADQLPLPPPSLNTNISADKSSDTAHGSITRSRRLELKAPIHQAQHLVVVHRSSHRALPPSPDTNHSPPPPKRYRDVVCSKSDLGTRSGLVPRSAPSPRRHCQGLVAVRITASTATFRRRVRPIWKGWNSQPYITKEPIRSLSNQNESDHTRIDSLVSGQGSTTSQRTQREDVRGNARKKREESLWSDCD
ncbi:hypothetical protein AKJ16_DCAP02314 [Drosera capensis]